MGKITILVSVVVGILLWAILPSDNPQSKIVWRGHTWDKPLDSTFVYKSDTDGIQIYAYKYEKTCIGSEHLDSVRYYFYKKKLLQVIVYIPTKEASKKYKQLGVYDAEIKKLITLMNTPKFNGYAQGHNVCANHGKRIPPYDNNSYIVSWKQGWDDNANCLSFKNSFDSLKLDLDKDSSFVNTDKIIAYYTMRYGESSKLVTFQGFKDIDCWFENLDKRDVIAIEIASSDFQLDINIHTGTITYLNFIEWQNSKHKIVEIIAKQKAKVDSVKNAAKNAEQDSKKDRMKKELEGCGI